jgi:hypothetical protein
MRRGDPVVAECICGKNGEPLYATTCLVHGTWRSMDVAPKRRRIEAFFFGTPTSATRSFAFGKMTAGLWDGTTQNSAIQHSGRRCLKRNPDRGSGNGEVDEILMGEAFAR